ncbi:amiloride-sensitive amine oxidase copper-containing [Podarcis lilfordi]|uniref:Amine oxidase n=1 Tax=Podarcis lilfordi TaxID=74358 RepID=A0AA35L561_9SAUR|nr:amiloride-sensitive amine oxidase copper-containing [Podarcis lilfordi]
MLSSALAIFGLLAAAASGQPPLRHEGVSIFSDLTPAELRAVRDFLLSRPELGLQADPEPSLAKNSLFLVELLTPKKGRALQYLESGSAAPTPGQSRGLFGAEAQPNVTEYVVWPLPEPTSYQPWEAGALRGAADVTAGVWAALAAAGGELGSAAAVPAGRLRLRLRELRRPVPDPDGGGPRGLASGERRTWLMLQRRGGLLPAPGGAGGPARPPGARPEPLAAALRSWPSSTPRAPCPSCLCRRTRTRASSPPSCRGALLAGPPTDAHGAKVCEPQGHRYWVEGNLVEYSGWSLAFRLRTSTGLQLFDVRFNGSAWPTSWRPASTAPRGPPSWKPTTCTTPGPRALPRALCVFELPTGVPLRRHFDSDFRGGSHFYAGLEGAALVLRTISTVYNYDYIWDFLLYPNGVLETKVHATGYVHASFYTPEGLRYGNRLHEHLLGNIHTHLVHYKVDLDVAGGALARSWEGAWGESGRP